MLLRFMQWFTIVSAILGLSGVVRDSNAGGSS